MLPKCISKCRWHICEWREKVKPDHKPELYQTGRNVFCGRSGWVSAAPPVYSRGHSHQALLEELFSEKTCIILEIKKYGYISEQFILQTLMDLFN